MEVALGALRELPRRYVVPAATASLAYLNAKYAIYNDLWGITQALTYGVVAKTMEKKDRINMFYTIEKWAKDPKCATRVFLFIPADPERPNEQTQWTYAEMYETVLKYAAWLKHTHNVQKGEIVAMDFTNRPQFLWMWFAIWSLGATPAFINSNLRDKAFLHCVRISETRLLVVDTQIREVLTDEVKAELGPDEKGRAVETCILDSELEQKILAGQPYRAPDEARSGAVFSSTAILIYTSGTTGLPKAANVDWGKPLSGCLFWYKVLGLTAEDRYFTAMPLYHSSASILCVCQAFGPGCAIVLASKFSPRTYMKMVSETGATAIQYIGEACRYLVSSPPSPYDRNHNVRLAFGNGMRPDVWQRFKDRFDIGTVVEFYGATEGPGALVVVSNNSFLRGAIGRSGIIARTLFGSNVLVRHDHDTDAPYRDPKTGFCVKCKAEETGELMHPLDPANISEKYHGYHGNEKATESKILRDVFKKGDAYYRTGDLQKRDSEGRWWFMDRIGDTFRWKSENVSTAEVSQALGSHPAVREANVYGVQLPNHDGRAGCAALTLADGHQLDDSTAKELAAHARKSLPRYAVPLFLRLMKEVEVTGTMKHQKVVLRNAGVDPTKTEGDELFWLEPSAEQYRSFGQKDWQRLVDGNAKL